MTTEPITAATAYMLPAPKGYLCAAGCGHFVSAHREAGCDVTLAGAGEAAPAFVCECPAPYGRILPSAEASDADGA